MKKQELEAGPEDAARLRLLQRSIGCHVLDLYVPGKGFWNCSLADRSVHPVRHCHDFATVLSTIGDLLSSDQKREMLHFFRNELQTPT